MSQSAVFNFLTFFYFKFAVFFTSMVLPTSEQVFLHLSQRERTSSLFVLVILDE